MRLRFAVILGALLGTLIATTAVLAQRDGGATRIDLVNVDGRTIGSVEFSETRYGTLDVEAKLRGLTPGFHGFHLHAVGDCEAPEFTSAGGHVKADDSAHGDHAGDLPPLLVKRNGTATLRATTDRLRLTDLEDGDGSAVVVHAARDNLAHIPSRYAPAPDQQTADTGDAGARVACGAFSPGG
jgi:superoxide dismutase, Cu-Zn family